MVESSMSTVRNPSFSGFGSTLLYIIWKRCHWRRDLTEVHRVLKVHWKEWLIGFSDARIRAHGMVFSGHRVKKCIFEAQTP